jgi:DNA-binding MarR family transcriptional regulator
MSPLCYCVVLRTAARKTTALYDALLEPAGVTLAQFSLLRKIKRVGPASLTRLGQLTELDRSTIGRNMKALEKLGLVRLGSAEDQREASARLTAAGERALQMGAPLWDEAQRRVEAALGETGAAQLQTLANGL